MGAVMVCNGKHLFNSRCTKDGYSIDEVLLQTERAIELVIHASSRGWGTALSSDPQPPDENGHSIIYEIVFECHGKYPRAALFSVIPYGDGKGPREKQHPLEEGVLVEQ